MTPSASEKFLTSDDTDKPFAGEVKLNFEKFLIARDGTIVARFRSAVEPNRTTWSKPSRRNWPSKLPRAN